MQIICPVVGNWQLNYTFVICQPVTHSYKLIIEYSKLQLSNACRL